MTLQDIIVELDRFWKSYGCILLEPYSSEVGAGTFNPATFFKVLEPGKWNVAYVELSKRPKDGRYAKNPIRFQQFYQYQVILKPAPFNVQELCLKSIETMGLELKQHDIRFVEDDWESETLGAAGLGWELWLDGMEILQFTYFQQMGGMELKITPVELTYGIGRIAMVVQGKKSFFEVEWGNKITHGKLYKQIEYEFSRFNFDEANIGLHLELFSKFEQEAKRLLELGLIYPGYDYVIKCSHILNVLDARRAISPSERKSYIARIRRLSNATAQEYIETIANEKDPSF
ncbi:MAG TPA: glycine--tRNA ligase subunit alpha [bacterium (Candidatus Stahlbacteria)]|nr:glycine--tRNA ligase subunit alpha [Candidatus Stahlbacteria bacterium]